MDHAQAQFFYRCYSNGSAGELRSGRYHAGHPALSEQDLLAEFDIHRNLDNRQPTALVSVTSRPLEALNRALKKYYLSHEDPGTIWVVIIRVPGGRNSNRPHQVKELARRMRLSDTDVFKYEYVFEWEIPEEYVVHRVSVRTLFHRGIERILGLHRLQYYQLSFPSFRNTLLEKILKSHSPRTESWLCSLAQAFGARAYTYEIAFRTLHNCLSGGYVDEDDQYVHWEDLCGSLEFSDIRDIEIGIYEQLDR